MEYRFRLKALVLAVSSTLVLGACGGGGSNDKSIQLSGIAAEGLAIANGTVTIKDKTGQTRSATTDSNGNYTIQTVGLTYPLMLQITGSQGVWHALVTEDDAGKPANINTATNSIAQLALGVSSDTALRAAFTTGTFSQVGAASVANADAKLLDALESELGKRPASLRHARFQPGTASITAKALKQAVAGWPTRRSRASTASLVTLAVSRSPPGRVRPTSEPVAPFCTREMVPASWLLAESL